MLYKHSACLTHSYGQSRSFRSNSLLTNSFPKLVVSLLRTGFLKKALGSLPSYLLVSLSRGEFVVGIGIADMMGEAQILAYFTFSVLLLIRDKDTFRKYNFMCSKQDAIKFIFHIRPSTIDL